MWKSAKKYFTKIKKCIILYLSLRQGLEANVLPNFFKKVLDKYFKGCYNKDIPDKGCSLKTTHWNTFKCFAGISRYHDDPHPVGTQKRRYYQYRPKQKCFRSVIGSEMSTRRFYSTTDRGKIPVFFRIFSPFLWADSVYIFANCLNWRLWQA